FFFFFSSRRRHTRSDRDWSSDVCSSDLISVSSGDKVKIHRIVAATDPGYAVNPGQIERQVAGSFVYGLSALFMEECTVEDGHIRSEERRVGKECRSRGAEYEYKRKSEEN